jgi:hypothetical protein
MISKTYGDWAVDTMVPKHLDSTVESKLEQQDDAESTQDTEGLKLP